MNTTLRTIVIALAACTTVAGSFNASYARDRDYQWRKHHQGRHFRNRAVTAGVLGLAAGVAIGALTQPRVVYRDRVVRRPGRVIVEDGPIYAEPDPYYIEPGDEYLGPVEEYDRAPRNAQLDPYDDDMRDDPGLGEDAFPQQPRKAEVPTQRTAQSKLEPWTAQWRNYCKQRFQSFNATTGTYTGYDGRQHFCTSQ